MTKELEETKAAGEEVALWLEGEAHVRFWAAFKQSPTVDVSDIVKRVREFEAMAATVRTLLSALSRGEGPTSHDTTTVEYAVREAVVEAANLGREGYDIPKAEAIVTEALRVIWNIAAAPPVPEGEE